MKGKFTKQAKSEKTITKKVVKTIPSLTVLIMALSMGIEVDAAEAMKFLRQTDEVKLVIEREVKSNYREVKASNYVDDDFLESVEEAKQQQAPPKVTMTPIPSEENKEDSSVDNKEASSSADSSIGITIAPAPSPETTVAPTVAPAPSPSVTPTVKPTVKPTTKPTVEPTYEPQDVDMITDFKAYLNISHDKVNTTAPEHRFDYIDECKEAIKKIYSSKYYDKSYHEGLENFSIADEQLVGNVYYLYNYQELRKAVEKKFGIENVYCLRDNPKQRQNRIYRQATPLCRALSQNAFMEEALTKKDNREFLTELAVKYNITTADDTSAPEAVLGVYYGIFNNDFSTANVKYNADKKLTREEFYKIYIKSNGGWRFCDLSKGQSKSDHYTTYTELASMNGMGAPAMTFKEKSQISKIEVLTMIARGYFGQTKDNNCEMSNYVKMTDKELINVIKKYNLSKNPSKYLKDSKIDREKEIPNCDGSYKLIFKKSKQLSYSCLKALAQCDKMGIIKPNSKGTINLYAPVTEKEAIKLITKGAVECKTYYDAWSNTY